MKNKKLVILGMCAIAGLTACGKAETQPVIETPTIEQEVETNNSNETSTEATEEVEIEVEIPAIKTGVEEMNRHQRAFAIADKIYEDKKENIMFSPTSLNLALGLVEEGASGITNAELNQFLCEKDFTPRAAELISFAKDRTIDQKEEWDTYKTVLNIANSLWLNDRYTLKDAYKEDIKNVYNAEIEKVSFDSNNLKETVDKINSWCNENTQEMIPSIVNEPLLSGDPASVLVNTVYFEAPWVSEWQVSEEVNEFHGADGKDYKTDFIVNYGDNRYFETDEFKAFSSRYRNGISFIGIMPTEDREFSLSEIDLNKLLESKKEGNYDLKTTMPKLNFSTNIDNIVEIMQGMGVSTAFDPSKATIDGMVEPINGNSLYISNIIQKTKLELDEKGTKAAAATAVIMMENAAIMDPPEVIEMTLDKPFAFVIYDEEVDEILFVGKVVNF